MWKRILMLALASCAMTPIPAEGRQAIRQDELAADFRVAQEQLSAGQPRQAANTLLKATLYIRQQVGRSKDEVVGMQLLHAESVLEKLALALREGRAGSPRTVSAELVRIDQLLAQHFVQMASSAVARPRADELPVVSRDIRLGAFHYERTFTLDGRTPNAEAVAILSEVRGLAAEIERTAAVPKSAAAMLAVFERQITGAVIVTAAQR